MKLKAQYVIPIIILVFVLIISVCSSCIKFMHGEGFDSMKGNSIQYSEYESGTTANGETTPSGEHATTPGLDGGENAHISSHEGEFVHETTHGAEYGTTPFSGAEVMSVYEEGFDTLEHVSADYHDEEEAPIDIYSQAHGDLSCEPNSYSNSGGYLCLDKNQKHQLMTRGMNQSGKSSQIGQA